MPDYRVAVYIRLSNADEETGSKKDESNSVVHQRMLLNRYLDQKEELKSCPRTEFVDDGFSGTNTDRPSFKRMIDQVKRGEINLICVKDFSRFSRDYIEIGDYLECLFPFLRVRFISVNDGYDSYDYKGTTGGLDVVMRNIVYAAYSKDLSAKVRSAKVQRRKKGHFVDGHVPMGYMRDPEDKHSLLIDEEAAAIIRRIFRMAAEGTGVTEIANALNEEGVPSPSQYRKLKGPQTHQDYGALDPKWSYSSLHVILKRYSYTGALVADTKLRTAPCSKHFRKQSREDWFVKENDQPAIISPEEYEKAQKIFKQMRKAKKTPKDYPLRSLVRCGGCGRIMKRRVKGYGFECRYRFDSEDSDCLKTGYETEKDLEEIVFNAIRMYIIGIEAAEKDARAFRSKKASGLQSLLDQLSSLQKREEHIKADKLRQYESYAAGVTAKDVYLRNKSSADEQLSAIREEIDQCERSMAELEHTLPEEKSMEQEVADRFKDQYELTNEMALAFIEAVYIQPGGQVEIRWKFKDPLEKNKD